MVLSIKNVQRDKEIDWDHHPQWHLLELVSLECFLQWISSQVGQGIHGGNKQKHKKK